MNCGCICAHTSIRQRFEVVHATSSSRVNMTHSTSGMPRASPSCFGRACRRLADDSRSLESFEIAAFGSSTRSARVIGLPPLMSPWSPCMWSACSRSGRRACRGRWTGHRHRPEAAKLSGQSGVAQGTARRTLRCACPWRNIARSKVAPLPPGIAGAALAAAITAWKISNFRNDGAQERTRTFTAVKPLAPEASASTNSTTWALGPVDKDRSHGCQIASSPSKYAVQRGRVGVSRIR